MTDLDKRLAALSPEQRKVLLRRLNREATPKDTEEQTISPQARETNVFPLSYSQERIWFLDQLNPGNYLYNMPRAVRLKGNLNIACLERALSEIIARHEILRTTFSIVNEEPVQIIHPPQPFHLSVEDLSHLFADEKITEAKHLAEKEAKHPFNLNQDLMVRAALLKLDEDDHVFLLTFHHIASDGWSYGVFTREFVTLYKNFSSGDPNPLPPLAIQYVDFAQWQRDWLQGERLNNQLNYWKQQLGGDLPQLELRHDKPPPANRSLTSAEIDWELPESLSRALKRLSQSEDCTLFMTMLAAFKLLLYRYTGQEDIIVGSPIAGRTRSELENLIGIFLNTLVLRTDLAGSPSFRELLQRVRRTMVDAYTHQDVPFEKLLIELHPERNLTRAPLFQVFFNMLNLEEGPGELPALTAEAFYTPDIGPKFDLTLYVREHAQQIQLMLVYSDDLFSQQQMTELLSQFEWVLEQIVDMPDRSIGDYSLVTPQVRPLLPDPTMLLEEPEQPLLYQMIREWVHRTPDQIAILQNDRSWTYAELDQRASLLAGELIRKGVQPGDVVGVCGPRSFDLIASMIAVFLSGGVLLSIDHTLPDQRKQLMLREANAKFLSLLETAKQVDVTWADTILPANQLLLDRSSDEVSTAGETLILSPVAFPDVSVHDPAYIFFTSGTTGVPKGVLGKHQGLSHFLKWQRDTFGVQPQDRAAQLTALSFDVVLRDIFVALISGATLCLPPEHIYLDARATLKWLQQTRISIVHTVPALAQTWISNAPADISLPDMRWIFFAGEPLKDALVHQWRAKFPHGQIVNLYGPTETTMAKCFYLVPHDPSPGIQPVGSPLPQTQALVLNQAGQLCGIGEPGEIVIRTPFRTLGYVNVPEENGRRFIPNPFRKDEQDKFYYSGDKGYFRSDGQLEILGRIDDQVKIRGIRIELGEIESLLVRNPDIQQAVVSVWEAGDDDKRLIAHVVLHKGHSLESGDLRFTLKKQLPDYMIPSVFIPIDVMPLTSNGKINRAALPLPEESQSTTHHGQLSARDDIEEKLVKIWEELLRVHPIGIQDSFFELGGHSLMAVHLFARINDEFGVNMPLATLFQEATIEYLATVIRQQNGVTTWSSLIEIEPRGDHLPFFCVHGLTGDILWFRDLAHCLAPNIPFYGLQSRGLDGIQTPETRIEDMAAHYIDEIRRVQPKGPYYLGGASFGGSVALEIAQQLYAQHDEVALLAIFDHALPNLDVDGSDGKYKRRLLIAYRILGNFPRWLKEFMKLGPSNMLQRFRRKLRMAQKVTIQKEQSNEAAQLDAADLIDFASELSAHRQQLITSNYQAIKMYVPKPYAGKVVLFRASNRSLLNISDPEESWQKIAPGRVKVFDVPSSHEGMFKMPHVDELAQKLRLASMTSVHNNL